MYSLLLLNSRRWRGMSEGGFPRLEFGIPAEFGLPTHRFRDFLKICILGHTTNLTSSLHFGTMLKLLRQRVYTVQLQFLLIIILCTVLAFLLVSCHTSDHGNYKRLGKMFRCREIWSIIEISPLTVRGPSVRVSQTRRNLSRLYSAALKIVNSYKNSFNFLNYSCTIDDPEIDSDWSYERSILQSFCSTRRLLDPLLLVQIFRENFELRTCEVASAFLREEDPART